MNLIVDRRLDPAERQLIQALTLKKRQSKKSHMSEKQVLARQQLADELLKLRKPTIAHTRSQCQLPVGAGRNLEACGGGKSSGGRQHPMLPMRQSKSSASLLKHQYQSGSHQFLASTSLASTSASDSTSKLAAAACDCTYSTSGCESACTCTCNLSTSSSHLLYEGLEDQQQQQQQQQQPQVVSVGNNKLTATMANHCDTTTTTTNYHHQHHHRISSVGSSCSFSRSDSSYSGSSQDSGAHMHMILEKEQHQVNEDEDEDEVSHRPVASEGTESAEADTTKGSADTNDGYDKEASIKFNKSRLEQLNAELEKRLYQYEYLVAQEKALLGTYNLMLFTSEGVNNFAY